MEKLNINEKLNVSYCIPLWLRDEQIKLAIKRVKERIQPVNEKRKDPIAVVCYGPSLNDTWEQIKEYKYIISCSGAHKFLIDRGIIPTWHCLTRTSRIPTEDGVKTIGWIVDNKYSGKVLSFQNNEYVWNRVIGWSNNINTNKKWVTIGGGIEKLTCTDDHRIAVTDNIFYPEIKYVEAKNSINSYTIRVSKPGRENPLYNTEQISVLIGTLLGDATLHKHDGTLYVSHKELHKEYVELKQSILFGTVSKITHNNFGGNFKSYLLHSPANAQTKELRDMLYKSGKKSILDILKYIDEVALAFWYMDDGNLMCEKSRKKQRARLYTMGFSDEEQTQLCNLFVEKWNIKPHIALQKRKNGTIHKYLKFSGTESQKLFALIAKYVAPCMEYKLPQEFRGGKKHRFDCKPLSYSAYKITELKPTHKKSNLYDIEVENAHNFVANGSLVHNCEVDPRKHKAELIGTPHKDVEYLIASTCHQAVFDHLEGYNVKLWHVFDHGEDAMRTLPHGEWALTGGCSVGLRAMVVARFLGFINLHIFGMDGCESDKYGKHAAEHPNQPKGYSIVEYNGIEYKTTPSMLECAKQTWHELNQMPDTNVIFFGNGLIQSMAKDYKPNYISNDKVIIGFTKSELISEEYKKLNAQLHNENLGYGVGGGKHADTVLKLVESLKNSTGKTNISILDYGCGKGYLAKHIPFPIWEYDPAIPGKEESPKPADLVICTDVLEHIEPDKLQCVLNDLARCVKELGYFTINTGPAKKKLPDGRNTHLIQENEEWWRKQLEEFFTVGTIITKGKDLYVVVGPKKTKKTNRKQ